MSYQLDPCPFCGGTDLRIGRACGVPYVACGSCGALGPDPSTTNDEREAVALWNSRRDREPDSEE